MKYKMIVQYDGTRYEGWQRQGNTDNTIQGKIEDVLTKMVGRTVEVQGAGRTDAGVHAWGQVASFEVATEKSGEEICQYLNQYLPEDIGVLSVKEMQARFHARLNAVGKIYVYRIQTGYRKNVFERKQIYPLGERLDLESMRQAAALLIGTHDFKSFCANKRMKKSTVRTLEDISIDLREDLKITYKGDGFLHHMARILTGTLIEVGQGKRKPESMIEIIKGEDRQLAGFTAPAKGLTLLEVKY